MSDRAILIRDENGQPVIQPQDTMARQVAALSGLLEIALKRIEDLSAAVATLTEHVHAQQPVLPLQFFPTNLPQPTNTPNWNPSNAPNWNEVSTTVTIGGSGGGTLFLVGENGPETFTTGGDYSTVTTTTHWLDHFSRSWTTSGPIANAEGS